MSPVLAQLLMALAPTGSDNVEEEAPSEEELNEADDSRGAASKGVDDNGSTEAVAMDKAGLIDLEMKIK